MWTCLEVDRLVGLGGAPDEQRVVGGSAGLFSVSPDGRGKPASLVFTAFHAYGGGTGVAKDIEVYTHYGHEGGVDYQVDWQLSWFVEWSPDQG
jgi:hypothetical protein